MRIFRNRADRRRRSRPPVESVVEPAVFHTVHADVYKLDLINKVELFVGAATVRDRYRDGDLPFSVGKRFGHRQMQYRTVERLSFAVVYAHGIIERHFFGVYYVVRKIYIVRPDDIRCVRFLFDRRRFCRRRGIGDVDTHVEFRGTRRRARKRAVRIRHCHSQRLCRGFVVIYGQRIAGDRRMLVRCLKRILVRIFGFAAARFGRNDERSALRRSEVVRNSAVLENCFLAVNGDGKLDADVARARRDRSRTARNRRECRRRIFERRRYDRFVGRSQRILGARAHYGNIFGEIGLSSAAYDKRYRFAVAQFFGFFDFDRRVFVACAQRECEAARCRRRKPYNGFFHILLLIGNDPMLCFVLLDIGRLNRTVGQSVRSLVIGEKAVYEDKSPIILGVVRNAYLYFSTRKLRKIGFV